MSPTTIVCAVSDEDIRGTQNSERTQPFEDSALGQTSKRFSETSRAGGSTIVGARVNRGRPRNVASDRLNRPAAQQAFFLIRRMQ
jgi:hypothetical protein